MKRVCCDKLYVLDSSKYIIISALQLNIEHSTYWEITHVLVHLSVYLVERSNGHPTQKLDVIPLKLNESGSIT